MWLSVGRQSIWKSERAFDESIEVARVHGAQQCLKAVRGTSYNCVTIMTDG
jgi:hypothetical protein